MRHWLTSRCILTALMLVVAPAAATAHLLINWVPERLDFVQLSQEILRDTGRLDAELEQCRALRGQLDELQQLAAAHTPARPLWLAQRDQRRVFDGLAEAFGGNRVSIERLTLGEPELYAAASYSNLLASERAVVECRGDYAALTSALDRVVTLDLPLRFGELTWRRAGAQLSLTLELDVPFVPDETLRITLADEAGLVEEDADDES